MAREQTVDQDAALIGVLVRQELRRLLRRGQRADDVEIHAPDKYFVGARIRGFDTQTLPLIESQIVDSAV
jgi:hypothetical protein